MLDGSQRQAWEPEQPYRACGPLERHEANRPSEDSWTGNTGERTFLGPGQSLFRRHQHQLHVNFIELAIPRPDLTANLFVLISPLSRSTPNF